MDANQTRFHILIGRDDWQSVIALPSSNSSQSDLVWDDESQSVTLAPRIFRFQRAASDTPPSFAARRGAVKDVYGNTYWITADGRGIRMMPAGRRESLLYWPAQDEEEEIKEVAGGFAPLHPPDPPEAPVFRGLTVTQEHYLVAGIPGGVMIFDLHTGGPPSWLKWPADVPIVPLDMAPRPDGGIVVLERHDGVVRYWSLDRNFGFREEGSDVGGSTRIDGPGAVAIEALPDGSVLVLETDEQTSQVHRYGWGRRLGTVDLSSAFQGLFEETESAFFPRGFDMAFVPLNDGQSGTLYICDAEGNQSYAFLFRGTTVKDSHVDAGGPDGLDLTLDRRYFPMRSFGGRGLVKDPTVTGEGRILYDREERGVVTWVPLTEMSRTRYQTSGRLDEVGMPQIFDGKERGCVWHRVMLDALIPKGAAIHIECRAGDDPHELRSLSWQRQPDPYLRPTGAEIPYYRPFEENESLISCEGGGTWETLLQETKGRYLQLRLTFAGSGQNTPKLRSLRVYYPRFSYLKEYLPAIYQEESTSASFLERYLANTEGLFTALEDRIANVQFLLDARTTPAEYLDWLAGWLGLSLEASWEEGRKRLLIRYASQLFAQRGTMAGLVRALRLATDPCPDDSIFTEPVRAVGGVQGVDRRGNWGIRIVEDYLTRRGPGVIFNDSSEREGQGMKSEQQAWRPSQGADPLHERYRTFLKGRYPDVATLSAVWGRTVATFDDVQFPPVQPSQGTEARDWHRFLAGPIGFTYASVTSDDQEAFQRFLSSRYRRIERLRSANLHGAASASSFAELTLPQRLPHSGQELVDWIQFVSIYVPTLRRAHRFTVLVPVGADHRENWRMQYDNVDINVVRRVVELEKPAHTAFDVKPYWALFRVGEARLGIDTQPGRSSRLGAAVLGQSTIGDVYLAHDYHWSVSGRYALGRERVGQRNDGEKETVR